MTDTLQTAPEVRVVRLSDLQLDPAAQPRAALDDATVEEYREAAAAGARFDLPIAVFDDGEKLWVGDGFHRVIAHRAAGLKVIEAAVRPGSRRDAILYSCGANAVHGLRRSPGDKRRAVETLLRDAEWSGWSDNEIARRARVSQSYVSALRKALPAEVDLARNKSNRLRRGADGRTINTAHIGRKPPKRPGPGGYEDDTPAYEDQSQDEPDAAPAGQSRVNGVLTADPPDVAAARAAGRIAPDVVPEVIDLEPTPEPGREPGSDDDREVPESELSDDDWLAKLPLSAVLAAGPLRVFRADALVYRRLEPHRKTFAYHAARALSGAGRGAFAWQVKRFLQVNHPSRWLACPAESDGGCGGSGVSPFGDCPRCHGRGYWILGG
jgi:hypothetical protein